MLLDTLLTAFWAQEKMSARAADADTVLAFVYTGQAIAALLLDILETDLLGAQPILARVDSHDRSGGQGPGPLPGNARSSPGVNP